MNNFIYDWGGLIATINELDGSDTLYFNRSDLKEYANRLKKLEESKDVEELQTGLNLFTKEERDYLHSPLLDHLTRVFKKPSWTDYPLVEASRHGYLDAIRVLLDKGVDVSEHRDFAFVQACGANHLDVMKYLHSRGADVHAENNAPFIHACAQEDTEMLEWLHNTGVNIHDENGMEKAVEMNNINAVAFLLDHGVFAEFKYGYRPVTIAIENNCIAITKLFLKLHPEIITQQSMMIAYASRNGHMEMVELLYSHGAPIQNVMPGIIDWLECLSRDNPIDILDALTNERFEKHKAVLQFYINKNENND